jgi:hypothetical protein
MDQAGVGLTMCVCVCALLIGLTRLVIKSSEQEKRHKYGAPKTLCVLVSSVFARVSSSSTLATPTVVIKVWLLVPAILHIIDGME